MKIARHYRPEACASKDKERFGLTDPYLDVEGRAVVATDGYRMVAIPVEVDDQDVSGYVARDLLKVARKKCKKEDFEAEIRERKELVPQGIEYPPDDARTFPDWRKVLPSFSEGEPGTVTIGLNANLLKGIADALGGAGVVALTVKVDSLETSPIRVRALSGNEREIAVLMPCRVGGAPRVRLDGILGEETPAETKAELDKQAGEILKAAGDAALARGAK